jgi:hypothetical protein
VIEGMCHVKTTVIFPESIRRHRKLKFNIHPRPGCIKESLEDVFESCYQRHFLLNLEAVDKNFPFVVDLNYLCAIVLLCEVEWGEGEMRFAVEREVKLLLISTMA